MLHILKLLSRDFVHKVRVLHQKTRKEKYTAANDDIEQKQKNI